MNKYINWVKGVPNTKKFKVNSLFLVELTSKNKDEDDTDKTFDFARLEEIGMVLFNCNPRLYEVSAYVPLHDSGPSELKWSRAAIKKVKEVLDSFSKTPNSLMGFSIPCPICDSRMDAYRSNVTGSVWDCRCPKCQPIAHTFMFSDQ